jgi:hydroxyacylglutathione hydrolase
VRLARVGIERVLGHLAGGIDGWSREGRGLATLQQISVTDLRSQLAERALEVVDVRRPTEHAEAHIPAARNLPLPDLEARVAELDRSRPIAVACAGGYRSSAACSLLERRGFRRLVNVVGGTSAWVKAGFPVDGASRAE